MSNLAPSFVFPPPAPAILNQIANPNTVERYITSAIGIRNSIRDFGGNPLQHIGSSAEIVTAHDIIDVSWTEPRDTAYPVQSIAVHCITCEEDSTQVLGDQKWGLCGNFTEGVHLTVNKTERQPNSQSIAFVIPEADADSYNRYPDCPKEDLLITSVCAFALGSASYLPSYMTPILSQIFIVNSRPRSSKVGYETPMRYRYNATTRQPVPRANTIQTYPLLTPLARGDEKNREISKKVGIIISVIIATIAVLYFLRLSGGNHDTDPLESPTSGEENHIAGEEARNRIPMHQQRSSSNSSSNAHRDGSNTPEQHHRAETMTTTTPTPDPGTPKPPPAYHEVVTDQERMLVQYAIQHANAPVPAYTQREEPSPFA